MLLLLSLGLAQMQAPVDAPPTKDQVMKFLEVTQARSRVEQLWEGMRKQGRLGAETAFKQQIPDATPEQLARVDAISDSIFQDFSADEMIDAVVPIYQKHLSKADIDSILAFYDSSAGKKLLKEMPAIMAESMEAGGKIGQKKISDISARIEEQMKAMIAEEQSKHSKQQARQPAKN
jgi:hypothetical protein